MSKPTVALVPPENWSAAPGFPMFAHPYTGAMFTFFLKCHHFLLKTQLFDSTKNIPPSQVDAAHLVSCQLEARLEKVNAFVHCGQTNTTSLCGSHCNRYGVTWPGLICWKCHRNLALNIKRRRKRRKGRTTITQDPLPNNPGARLVILYWIPDSQRKAWRQTAYYLQPLLHSPAHNMQEDGPGEPCLEWLRNR